MSETVEILERLIAFDTTSRNSNLELLAWIEERLDRHGIGARRIPNDDDTKANLVARIGPKVDGGIVLCGHTDTVPVDGQPWGTDPFTLTEKDGLLHGRGTADMKGFIASTLAAVPALASANLVRPVTLAFTYDEEVGCFGAPSLAADLVAEEPTPALVVVGEPTSMQICRAHKGIRLVRTSVRGLDAHSSQNRPSANAIMAAGRIINFLADLSVEFRESGLRVDGFDPPHTTTNVGVISGGQAINIVPSHCEFSWEFRPVPGVDPDAVFDRVVRFSNEVVLPELRRQHPHAEIRFEILAQTPPLDAARNADAAKLLTSRFGHAEGTPVSFGSDGAALQDAGLQVALLGPGSIDQGHQPNEFIAREQLDRCDAFLADVVDWAAAE